MEMEGTTHRAGLVSVRADKGEVRGEPKGGQVSTTEEDLTEEVEQAGEKRKRTETGDSGNLDLSFRNTVKVIISNSNQRMKDLSKS